MTTHMTHDGGSLAPGDEEEPELVLIDDDEFEAAHRVGQVDDENLMADEDEPEFSFEDELDEAIALDMSDEMDPASRTRTSGWRRCSVRSMRRPIRRIWFSQVKVATAQRAMAQVSPLPRSPRRSCPSRRPGPKRSAEREALKRRKEIDKAASQDEKERLRDEKAAAVAAERAAAAAQKETAEAEKREAAEAKKQAAEDKKQAAEDEKRAAAAGRKARQAEEKAAQKAEQKAEAQRARDEAKQSRAEAKRKAKRKEEPIVPAGLTRFVVDEQPEPAATQTRKDARLKKQGTTRSADRRHDRDPPRAVAGDRRLRHDRVEAEGRCPGGTAHANALPAAMATLVSANSADVAYAQHIGGPIPADVNGGGSVDLATQGSNLSVTYSMAGQKFPEQIIYVGGQAFYDLGAIVHYVTPAYNWVSTDLAAGAPGSPGIGVGGVMADPSALVSVVQASAPSAKVSGSVKLNGVPVTEYSITLDRAAVTRPAGHARACLPTCTQRRTPSSTSRCTWMVRGTWPASWPAGPTPSRATR